MMTTCPSRWWLIGSLVATACAVVALRLAGPADMLGHNEPRMVCYILDVVHNGQWIVQHHAEGALATKPPLFTWVASLAALATGEVNRFAIYSPSILALVLLGVLVMLGTEPGAGPWVGAWAGLVMVVSPLAIKECLSARYDLFFTVPVMLGGWAAFRAWQTGRGWTWFWLAAATATLTKGPLGLLLAALGLLAAVWEWRTGHPARIRGSHGVGIVCYLGLTLGWLALAYRQEGAALLQTLFAAELVQGATGFENEAAWRNMYKPMLVLLGEFAPWGWLALCGVWRACRTPATDPAERRWERFLTCWLVTGLLLFTIAVHTGARLLLPLLPPVAWLAGRELMRWLERWRISVRWAFVGATAAGLVLAVVLTFVFPGHSNNLAETDALHEFGERMERTVGTAFPLTYLSNTTMARAEMDVMYASATVPAASELLRGSVPSFVLTRDFAALRRALGTNGPATYVLFQQANLSLISNHPRLEWTERIALGTGPWRIELAGYCLDRQRGQELTFAPLDKPAYVQIVNAGREPRPVTLRLKSAVFHATLRTGEVYRAVAK